MSKIIFCNIAWMKKYRGMTEDDKPVNGGKFVNETGTAYECYNFFPVNHFCYGYFQNNGQQLNLKRIDKNIGNSEVVQDVTVVWVANRKIVGWYEKAEVLDIGRVSMSLNLMKTIRIGIIGVNRVKRTFFLFRRRKEIFLFLHLHKMDRVKEWGKQIFGMRTVIGFKKFLSQRLKNILRLYEENVQLNI